MDPANLDSVFAVVHQSYIDDYQPQTKQAAEQLAQMRSTLTQRYHSKPRVLASVAATAISRYINSELDFQTPTSRGVGRITASIPRLAAFRRSAFHAYPGLADELAPLLQQHIACGYLFADYFLDIHRGSEASQDSERLFEQATICTYSSSMQEEMKGLIDLEVLGVWSQATYKPIKKRLMAAGVVCNDDDIQIIIHYSYLGVFLRILEARPLPEETILKIATGGGYPGHI